MHIQYTYCNWINYFSCLHTPLAVWHALSGLLFLFVCSKRELAYALLSVGVLFCMRLHTYSRNFFIPPRPFPYFLPLLKLSKAVGVMIKINAHMLNRVISMKSKIISVFKLIDSFLTLFSLALALFLFYNFSLILTWIFSKHVCCVHMWCICFTAKYPLVLLCLCRQ